MSKKLLSTLIASLFAAAPAFAQSNDDPMRVQGTATLGGIYNNVNAQDTAQAPAIPGPQQRRAVERRRPGPQQHDLVPGLRRELRPRPTSTCSCAAACTTSSSPARTSTKSRTPSTRRRSRRTPAAARNLLTAVFPQYNPNTWNSFKDGYERKDAGGYFEWQKNSPWYFRVDGNEVKFDGTKVGAAANGTSPGNGFVDLAFPVQYKTSNWGVEGGYQSSKATLSLRWDYSKFDNSNDSFQWTNPFFGGNSLDRTYLPPDNTFNKFTVTGNYRDLPWRSVISARYTWAKTTSDVNLGQSALNGNNIYSPSLPEPVFVQRRQRQPVVRAGLDGHAGRERRYAGLLLLDEAAEQLGRDPVRQRADAAADERAELRQLAVNGVPTADRRQLRERALQLHEERRRLRRVVALHEGPAAGLRLRLHEPRPEPGRLRQVAHEHGVGRVQEHDAGHRQRPAQVLVPEARLDAELQQRGRCRRTTRTTCCPTRRRSTCSPARPTGSSSTSTGTRWRTWASRSRATGPSRTTTDVTYGRTTADRQGYFLTGNWGDAAKLLLTAFGSWEETKYPSDHRYIGTVASGPNPPPG